MVFEEKLNLFSFKESGSNSYKNKMVLWYIKRIDIKIIIIIIIDIGLVIEPLSSGSGLGLARKARLELGS